MEISDVKPTSTPWSLTVPTNAEKKAVWDACNALRPIRVPLKWGHCSRIAVLNPELNPEGHTYEQMHHDPRPLMEHEGFVGDYYGFRPAASEVGRKKQARESGGQATIYKEH
jgi:hypothetical protein